MRVVFDDEALEDLRRIFEWISKDNPKAADALVARGHEVIHLIGGAQKRHQPTPVARIEDGRVTYPALL